MRDQDISDEFLNSFVDNQLDPAEKAHAFDTIRQDEKLKERVCELRGLKEMMQQAYSNPPPHRQSPIVKRIPSATKHYQALAACLLLLVGGASGWFTHAWSMRDNNQELTLLQTAQHEDVISEGRNVIVHLANSSPYRLKAALDETEGLLETYKRAHLQLQVEVITNKSGVDLLRSDASIYKQRIGFLQEKYPNVNFLVCGQTLGKLRGKGESVQLLPHTVVVTTAAEQINKRLSQGWGYVRI